MACVLGGILVGAISNFSLYPDYPIIGFLDFLATHMQKMSSRSESSAEFRDKLQKFYDTGRKEALVP